MINHSMIIVLTALPHCYINRFMSLIGYESLKVTLILECRLRETLGVPVRIEIGPQDVAKGNCVVARATGEPGTVAEKSTMKMSKALVKHVRQALSDAGVKLGKAEGASTSDPADDEGLEPVVFCTIFTILVFRPC